MDYIKDILKIIKGIDLIFYMQMTKKTKSQYMKEILKMIYLFDGNRTLTIENIGYYREEFKNGKGKFYDSNNNLAYDGHFVNDEKEGDNEKKYMKTALNI